MKYKLTGETIQYQSRTLYRIQALKDFGDVKAGDLGGWVEKESNLSQEGDCWIYNNAKVFDNAQVLGNAKVSLNARVFDNARVFEGARVYGGANVCEKAWIYGSARVYGEALICGKTRVFDNAQVFGGFSVYGEARISKNAYIKSSKDYCCFQGFGSESRTTTFYLNGDKKICVVCGCFEGSLKEFKSKVRETHGYSKFAKEYLKMIKLAKLRLKNESTVSK